MPWQMIQWGHGKRHHVGMLKNGGMGNHPFPAEKVQIQLIHCIQSRALQ